MEIYGRADHVTIGEMISRGRQMSVKDSIHTCLFLLCFTRAFLWCVLFLTDSKKGYMFMCMFFFHQ